MTRVKATKPTNDNAVAIASNSTEPRRRRTVLAIHPAASSPTGTTSHAADAPTTVLATGSRRCSPPSQGGGNGTPPPGSARTPPAPSVGSPASVRDSVSRSTFDSCTNSWTIGGIQHATTATAAHSVARFHRIHERPVRAMAKPSAQHTGNEHEGEIADVRLNEHACGNGCEHQRARLPEGEDPREQHEEHEEWIREVRVPRFEHHRRTHRSVREPDQREYRDEV